MPRADGNARPPDGRRAIVAGAQVLWFATVSAGSRAAYVPGVMTFLVETYLSRDALGEPDRTIARAIAAAEETDASGQAIRYVRSIFIPDDEVCLLLFEAGSAEIVGEAARRAGLDPERITLADSRDRVVRS
jgi:hypothetical protein